MAACVQNACLVLCSFTWEFPGVHRRAGQQTSQGEDGTTGKCFINTVELLLIWLCCYLQQSVVTWHGNKLVCEQIGEKKCRGWSHWTEDNKTSKNAEDEIHNERWRIFV